MEGEQRSVWPIALVDLLIPGLMSLVSKGQSNTTSVIPTLRGIISSCFLLGQEGDRHRGFLSILWRINKNTVNDHLSWLMEKKNSLFGSSDPAEGHVNEWTAVWRKGLVVAVEIYCWAAESMLLQVNPQAWPRNHRWHLKHEAVCLPRCVFCSCQLQAVLSPLPWRSQVRKNVTDCPLAKAVWGEWHLKNSTSSKNPSSENNNLLFLSHQGRVSLHFSSIFTLIFYSKCSKVELCMCLNPVRSFVSSKQV